MGFVSKKGDNIYRVIQADGGGIRGVIGAIICNAIQDKMGKPLCNIFDSMIGTSTGAILAGVLSAGANAKQVMDMYINDGPRLFSPRSIFNPKRWTEGKYDRQPFIDKIKSIIGDMKLCEVKTKYTATAFNDSSGRTHFINSDDVIDGQYKLVDIISWSALSAADYFGKINVPQFTWDHYGPDGNVDKAYMGATFYDGGQGINNSTLKEVMNECFAKGYENAVIISLGCGGQDPYVPYSKTSDIGFVMSVIDYLGQARAESTINQVLDAKYIQSNKPNIKVFRIDSFISKEMDELDAIKYVSKFQEIGNSLISKIPFNLL